MSSAHAPSVPAAAPASCPASSSTKSSTCSCPLLTWKNPVETGKVLASIVVVLVVLKTVNVIPVFFYTLAGSLALSAVVEYVSVLVTGTGIVSKYRPTKATFGPCFKENVLPQLASAVNLGEHIVQVTVFSVDPVATLKTAGVAYILYKVTSWFSIFTIVATSVALAFSVPYIYSTYQKEIDSAVTEYSSLAQDKADEYYKLAHKKAAPYANQFVEKTGPVGSFVKAKFPTRTAGSTVNSSKYPAAASSASATSTTTSATTTGASKFPDVPESQLKSTTAVNTTAPLTEPKVAINTTAPLSEPLIPASNSTEVPLAEPKIVDPEHKSKADLPQPTEY